MTLILSPLLQLAPTVTIRGDLRLGLGFIIEVRVRFNIRGTMSATKASMRVTRSMTAAGSAVLLQVEAAPKKAAPKKARKALEDDPSIVGIAELIYTFEYAETISDKTISGKERAKRASERWEAMSQEEKKPYITRAQDEDNKKKARVKKLIEEDEERARKEREVLRKEREAYDNWLQHQKKNSMAPTLEAYANWRRRQMMKNTMAPAPDEL